MGNMSYCRFRNTCEDLSDCQENMDDAAIGDEEERARRVLIRMCCEIAADYGDEIPVP